MSRQNPGSSRQDRSIPGSDSRQHNRFPAVIHILPGKRAYNSRQVGVSFPADKTRQHLVSRHGPSTLPGNAERTLCLTGKGGTDPLPGTVSRTGPSNLGSVLEHPAGSRVRSAALSPYPGSMQGTVCPC